MITTFVSLPITSQASVDNNTNQNKHLSDSSKTLQSTTKAEKINSNTLEPGIKDRILIYNSFEYRAEAISSLRGYDIAHLYNYVPAMVINNLPKDSIPLDGLKQAGINNPISKATVESQVDLDQEVSGNTLGDTAQMIGVSYLRDNFGLTGAGVTIAILDSGVDTSLRSYDDRVTTRVVPGLADKGSLDQDGHGSHVTGIAAGNGMYKIDGEWQQTDSPGMAPGASIESIRVLDENGAGENAWVIQGIEMAIDLDVDIISMSLTTAVYNGTGDLMLEWIEVADDEDIIVVGAAGNTGPIGNAIGLPGGYESVISVGATFPNPDWSQEIWTFSAVGPSVNHFPGPYIVAPGFDIISVNIGTGTVFSLSGTSMAAPHVSGGIALLLEEIPSATPIQIKEALLSGAVLIGNSNGLTEQVEAQGRGFVRFDRSLEILRIITSDETADEHLEMPILPNIIQDRNYVYYNRIIGQTKVLPFFIHSSRNITVVPNIDTSYTTGVNFTFSEDHYNLTVGLNRIEIAITVTSQTITTNLGRVYFTENITNSILHSANITYTSESRYSRANILFDTTHDLDTLSGYFANQGPTGQFSQFVRRLADRGHHVSSSGNVTISTSLLENYDMLVLADPDLAYSVQEINAIKAFMETDGKSVLIIAGGGLFDVEGEPVFPSFDKESLNSIIADTGIQFPMDGLTPYSVSRCNFELSSYVDRQTNCVNEGTISPAQDIFDDLYSFPTFGPEMEMTESIESVVDTFPIAFQSGSMIAAAAEYQSGGRLLVYSSPLLFDNNGILYGYGSYGSAETNEIIATESVEWLIEPNSAKVNYVINDQPTEESIELNLHETYTISFSAEDKDGNPILFGDSVFIRSSIYDIQDNIYGYINLPFNRIPGTNVYESPLQISKNSELNFYLHVVVNGSIPSDGHLELIIQLKNFEIQDQLRDVGRIFFLLVFLSWIFWLLNEGGQRKKKN